MCLLNFLVTYRYQVSGETGWFMLVWFVLWGSSLFFVRRVTLMSRKDANMTVAEKRTATCIFAAAYVKRTKSRAPFKTLCCAFFLFVITDFF